MRVPSALHPFVTLDQFPTASFSIWFWSALGTAFYHLSIFQVARKFLPNFQTRWAIISAIAIWVCSPDLLLSLNSVLYHEPISFAYGATGVAVFLMLRCALFETPWRWALIPTAIMAGLVLHARPHVAVDLYAGTVTMIAFAL